MSNKANTVVNNSYYEIHISFYNEQKVEENKLSNMSAIFSKPLIIALHKHILNMTTQSLNNVLLKTVS